MVVDQEGNRYNVFGHNTALIQSTPGTTNGIGSFTIPTVAWAPKGAFEITPLRDLIPATIPIVSRRDCHR